MNTIETTAIEEFSEGFTEIKEGITRMDKNITDLSASLKTVQDENERLQT